MPNIKMCAVCQGHNATNYRLAKTFNIPELGTSTSSVSAGSIDLCDRCWDRYVNRRTLTLDKIEERIVTRKAKIIADHAQPDLGI